jgi:hypothetical protein
MSNTDERSIIEQFSHGKISRVEASRRLGEDISFSDMLRKLWKYNLHLPRYKTDLNSAGVRLIHDLANRGTHV